MSICEKCKENHDCAWQNHEETICKEKPAFPLTNADRIRSMTDEELAEIITDDWCEILGCNLCDEGCERRVLDWLKKEAKDD